MITLGLQIVIILLLVYYYIATKREFKNLYRYLVDVKNNLNERIIVCSQNLYDKQKEIQSEVNKLYSYQQPEDPKKFVPKDKQLYEEELRENVNIYRG